MNLILLGAPGAGKGTQGALLAGALGVPRISTGDLLRDAVRRGSPLGRRAKRIMDAGELVPDSVILELVREVVSDRGAVFDGFPRTIAQAEGLAELLERRGQRLDAVALIRVPEDMLVKRLSGRRSCPNCNRTFNVHFDPPTEAGVCDACGNALVARADDDEATVRRRLLVYAEQTEPLIEHYKESGVAFHRVDGDRPVNEVQADLRERLGL